MCSTDSKWLSHLELTAGSARLNFSTVLCAIFFFSGIFSRWGRRKKTKKTPSYFCFWTFSICRNAQLERSTRPLSGASTPTSSLTEVKIHATQEGKKKRQFSVWIFWNIFVFVRRCFSLRSLRFPGVRHSPQRRHQLWGKRVQILPINSMNILKVWRFFVFHQNESSQNSWDFKAAPRKTTAFLLATNKIGKFTTYLFFSSHYLYKTENALERTSFQAKDSKRFGEEQSMFESFSHSILYVGWMLNSNESKNHP